MSEFDADYSLEEIRRRPQSKGWQVVKLNKPKLAARDPGEFTALLKTAFKPLFKTVIRCDVDGDGALWAQVEILGISIKKAKGSIYLVHYPHAKFVFISKVRQAQVHDTLKAAIQAAFLASDVVVVNCSGKHIDALADVALHPLSQGQFGSYRLYTALLDNNPLDDQDEDEVAVGQRRNVRVQDRAMARRLREDELGVQGKKPRGMQEAGGVQDQNQLREDEDTVATSGALTHKQREVQTVGTRALNRVELQVETELEWQQESIPFKCTVTVAGEGVMHGISEWSKMTSRQSGKTIVPALSEASSVIQHALDSKSGRDSKVRAVGLMAM